ncbi:cell division protein FtsL [Exilibacterium tricleocarpae]|uniref:Cell division protein FtsL n=1 Tax=Exilibacterium tricleocarpae TaxID=2591008 RepID=A0A545TQA6_9GAMM|nr:cell division protein FtsL [Exilibacterium tricleocarpae]TQV79419.1 cell division protein FtsL [Exilibacterium tricleocarpae]
MPARKIPVSKTPASLGQGFTAALPRLSPARVGLMLLWLAVLGSALGVVYTTHQSRLLVHQLELARKETAEQQVAWGQYLLEQSTWAAYHRIEHLAVSRLDMYVPDTADIVMVD